MTDYNKVLEEEITFLQKELKKLRTELTKASKEGISTPYKNAMSMYLQVQRQLLRLLSQAGVDEEDLLEEFNR